MTIRFEVQKFKAGKNGTAPVEAFIRANGKTVKMTLVKRLNPAMWSSKNQTLLVNDTSLFAALKAHGIDASGGLDISDYSSKTFPVGTEEFGNILTYLKVVKTKLEDCEMDNKPKMSIRI